MSTNSNDTSLDFIENARHDGSNDSHLYVLGAIFSFIGGQALGSIPLLVLMIQRGVLDAQAFTNPALLGISTNSFLILVLLPFILSFFILWLFIRFIHKKKFINSLTNFHHIKWSKFYFAFFLWFIMAGLSDLAYFAIRPGDYEFNVPDASFLFLVAISLIMIPIQTSYEELLFRSYILQGIGLWKPYRILPYLFSSFLFGFVHIMNPEVGEYGYLVMVQYIGTGLLLGALVMLSDSMELSLGMHAANNIYSSVLVSYKASVLTTNSLFYCTEMRLNYFTTILSMGIFILYGFILHKKYKLKPITYLFSKIEKSKG